MRPLTKTQFVKGLDCVRRVWLDRNRPDLKPELSIGALGRIETGGRVGKFAHGRYPEGVLLGGEDLADQVAETQKALASGPGPFFEASLLADNCLARLDVVWKGESGWVIDEVKSSSVKEPGRIDEDKAMDLAFQVRVASKAGMQVEATRMVLIDTSKPWDGGPYDPHTMLGVVDLTERCHSLSQKVEDQVAAQLAALQATEPPEVEVNTHCKKCDFFGHCYADGPKNSILHLPNVSPKMVRELRAVGAESIEQIPEDHRLSDPQRRIRNVHVSGKSHVGEGLAEALEAIAFPAACIDYESVNPAFPIYPGARPYQQICFQWSAHLLETPDAEPIHTEYLPTDAADPRDRFCASLWEAVRDAKSILHYTKFEITQMKAMAAAGIPYAAELLDALQSRSVDLFEIVKAHVYLEDFQCSYSIKKVLPALVPSMTYKDLIIGDGQAASAGFLRMISPETEPEEKAELRRALLEYCCQDTLAMVEIYRALRRMAMSP